MIERPRFISDAELRHMRDVVYEIRSNLLNWEACKDAWRRDEAWLMAEYQRTLAKGKR